MYEGVTLPFDAFTFQLYVPADDNVKSQEFVPIFEHLAVAGLARALSKSAYSVYLLSLPAQFIPQLGFGDVHDAETVVLVRI